MDAVYEEIFKLDMDLLEVRMIRENNVDIENYMTKKIEACSCYRTEYRDFPHPRSKAGLLSRARYWGMQAGLSYAEAFQVIRLIR